MTPRSILRHTIAVALVAAAIELAITAWRTFAQGHMLMGSWQLLWLTPASSVLMFLPMAIALAAVAIMAPRRLPAAAAFGLAIGAAAFAVLFLFHPRLHLAAIALLSAGVMVQVARTLRRGHRRVATVIDSMALAVALLAALAGVVLNASRALTERRALAGQPAARSLPNVLLVVLDTVRAESLSLYGYERQTSPALDRFAARGTTFLHAYSTTSWTLPSHATLFTGRYPHELSADWEAPLDTTHPTLAQVFAERGYATGGFVANVAYTSRETGLNRGFARYEDYTLAPSDLVVSSSLGRFVTNNPRFRQLIGFQDILGRKSATDVGQALTHWLARGDGRPYFAFVNLYDAHEPYLPPPPFDDAFGPVGYRNLTEIRQLNPRIAERRRKSSMPAAERVEEQRAYDQSVAALDDQLGRLFTDLEAGGHLRNTVVVITADHGEHFGEHNLFGHGTALYLPTLHVPLVVVHPETVPAGVREAARVTLRDVPATIAGIALGQPSLFPGRSLLTQSEGTPSPILASLEPAPVNESGAPVALGPMRSAIVDDYHYVRNGDGREELYDLRRDPGEASNLAVEASLGAILERSRAALASSGAPRR